MHPEIHALSARASNLRTLRATNVPFPFCQFPLACGFNGKPAYGFWGFVVSDLLNAFFLLPFFIASSSFSGGVCVVPSGLEPGGMNFNRRMYTISRESIMGGRIFGDRISGFS